MGTLIGDPLYPTWGRFRRPMSTIYSSFTVSDYNIEWTDGFMTSAGNGFFRSDPQFPYLGQPKLGLDPSNPTQFKLFEASTAIVIDQREADELISATVTGTTDSLVINPDFQLASGQTAPPLYTEPITAIDKLAPF